MTGVVLRREWNVLIGLMTLIFYLVIQSRSGGLEATIWLEWNFTDFKSTADGVEPLKINHSYGFRIFHSFTHSITGLIWYSDTAWVNVNNIFSGFEPYFTQLNSFAYVGTMRRWIGLLFDCLIFVHLSKCTNLLLRQFKCNGNGFIWQCNLVEY